MDTLWTLRRNTWAGSSFEQYSGWRISLVPGADISYFQVSTGLMAHRRAFIIPYNWVVSDPQSVVNWRGIPLAYRQRIPTDGGVEY